VGLLHSCICHFDLPDAQPGIVKKSIFKAAKKAVDAPKEFPIHLILID
jgi:hypothetical protein